MHSTIVWNSPSQLPARRSDNRFDNWSIPILIAQTGNPMSTLVKPVVVQEGVFCYHDGNPKDGVFMVYGKYGYGMVRAVGWAEIPTYPSPVQEEVAQ